VTSPTMRIPRPGPGNGWRPTISSGQAELGADGAHLVLEQGAQRLDELELQVLRQPAHVVVALDVGCVPVAAAGFDDVRVQGALHEELDLFAVRCGVGDDRALGLSKARMNSRPMILRLVSGSLTPASAVWNAPARRPRRGSRRWRHEVLLDLLGLAFAQQPVVDEDTGELVADCRCTRAAATAESTPPERPQMTRASPTCFRMRSTCSSRMLPVVQFGSSRRP
jgi:hypothetical protein